MAEEAAAASSSGSFAPPRRRLLHGAGLVRDALPYGGLPLAAPPPPVPQAQGAAAGGGGGGGGSGKISPAVLFIIVILAVVFFVSGLLHLLVRLLMKKQQHRRGGGTPASAAAAAGGEEADAALQRQLQQLFHLHDAGLDQAFIDALPVFAYREIVVGCGGDGDKEPFDCAVCLCEFDAEDRLRLLPLCGHAFHLNCIDTWLLSNSTCPLCRGVLFGPGLMAGDNPMFDFEEEPLQEGRLSDECEDGLKAQTPVAEKRVFPVRLGKFKNVGTQGAVEGGNANPRVLSRDQGETSSSSSSSLDGRRCFSMGTYQYVLGTSELRVALQPGRTRNNAGAAAAARGAPAGLSSINADIMEGKKICARNKGESFSVSKIWQWSNLKGKLPAGGSDDCSDAGSLPSWMKRGGGGAGDTSNIWPDILMD